MSFKQVNRCRSLNGLMVLRLVGLNSEVTRFIKGPRPFVKADKRAILKVVGVSCSSFSEGLRFEKVGLRSPSKNGKDHAESGDGYLLSGKQVEIMGLHNPGCLGNIPLYYPQNDHLPGHRERGGMLMPMKRMIMVFLVTILMLGCAGSKKINRVNLGMTKAEVYDVMGQPDSTSEAMGVQYLRYKLITDVVFSDDFYVRLEDGKVTAYGRFKDFVYEY